MAAQIINEMLQWKFGQCIKFVDLTKWNGFLGITW